MTPYRLTRMAQSDLERIWRYTVEQHSPSQADKYLDGLLSRFETIAKNPTEGKSIDSIREGYKKLPYAKHTIFFRIAADDVVEIIRVLHVRMDIESRL